MNHNVALHLTRHALAHPNRPALIRGDRQITFWEMERQVNALAHGLAARGIQAGDRVVVSMAQVRVREWPPRADLTTPTVVGRATKCNNCNVDCGSRPSDLRDDAFMP